jgi:hypothetical protein
MKLATNKDLEKWFKQFNRRFFENRIDPRVQVRFAMSEDDRDVIGDDCDGVYLVDEKVILIDKALRGYRRLTQMILLHEMIHAEIPKHISQPFIEDHGMLFQHRMVELFNAGAFDGLL